MNDLDKNQVAEKVRSYLVNKRPGGVFLEVVEEDIRKVDELATGEPATPASKQTAPAKVA